MEDRLVVPGVDAEVGVAVPVDIERLAASRRRRARGRAALHRRERGAGGGGDGAEPGAEGPAGGGGLPGLGPVSFEGRRGQVGEGFLFRMRSGARMLQQATHLELRAMRRERIVRGRAEAIALQREVLGFLSTAAFARAGAFPWVAVGWGVMMRLEFVG